MALGIDDENKSMAVLSQEYGGDCKHVNRFWLLSRDLEFSRTPMPIVGFSTNSECTELYFMQFSGKRNTGKDKESKN
jgi:hypothetical protein